MGSEFVPLKGWPPKQPWRMRRGATVFVHPDTGRVLTLAQATTEELDRIWGALHAWEHQHAGTLIGDHARQLRVEHIEAEDCARRALRLADPIPPQQAAA